MPIPIAGMMPRRSVRRPVTTPPRPKPIIAKVYASDAAPRVPPSSACTFGSTTTTDHTPTLPTVAIARAISNRRHAAGESGAKVETLRPGAEDVVNWVLRWQDFLVQRASACRKVVWDAGSRQVADGTALRSSAQPMRDSSRGSCRCHFRDIASRSVATAHAPGVLTRSLQSLVRRAHELEAIRDQHSAFGTERRLAVLALDAAT